MGDNKGNEGAPAGVEEFEVAGLSRRALLDRMKMLGVGFGAAYMLGITNADAATAPEGGMARIRSKDEALNAIIEEGEDAEGLTRVADSAGEEGGGGGEVYSRGYARGYSRDSYARGYGRGYSRGYSRAVYSRGYGRGYGRGYSRGYSRHVGYSRGYSRHVGYSRGYSRHGGGYSRHYSRGGGHRPGGGRGGRGGGRGGGHGRRSDLRSKENVTLLGHIENGLGFYRFNYLEGETSYVGVIAQEVQAMYPDAVVRGSDGYLRVLYNRLGLRMQTFEEWRSDGGTIPAIIH